MYSSKITPYGPYVTVDPITADCVWSVLDRVGVDVFGSQHTKMTPYRLAHYLEYWYRPPDDVRFTVFDNEDPVIDQMVTVDPIPFWACCSHHMLPFFGQVYFGYLPGDKIIGLSQIQMQVQSFCARPWLQETMVKELADVLEELSNPQGLGLIVRATHTCQMLDLGPIVPNMTFSELRGCFREHHAVRDEFWKLAGI